MHHIRSAPQKIILTAFKVEKSVMESVRNLKIPSLDSTGMISCRPLFWAVKVSFDDSRGKNESQNDVFILSEELACLLSPS